MRSSDASPDLVAVTHLRDRWLSVLVFMASAVALVACQASTATAPVGLACLPSSPLARSCRAVPLVSHPDDPESQAPQLRVHVLDPEFERIVGRTPQLVPLATGFGFVEGPVFLKDRQGPGGLILLTDQIHNSIYALRWKGLVDGAIRPASWEAPRLYRNPSGVADGQTVGLGGELLTAETTGRRVSMTRDPRAIDADVGVQAETLVDHFQGKRLNSPNDLVVKSDGTVWFTDPSYGSLQFPPQPAQLPNNVYRYDPRSKRLTVVDSSLKMPNGIAFGPGEKSVYIIDSGAIQGPRTYFSYLPHQINVYDVQPDGRTLANKRLFATISPGFPDGLRLDSNGNVYVGALDGIHVLNPRGKLIGQFRMAKQTANLTFGGTENNVLFIGSSDTLWAIKLNTRGLVPVRARG